MRMIMGAMVAMAAACSGSGPANGSGGAAPSNVSEVAPQPDSGSIVMLNAAENGRPVEIGVGQEVGIRLDEHPSVGSTWEAIDLPPQLRASGKDSTVPANVAPGGDRGMTTFRFVATGPGSVTLRMVNKFRGDPVGERTIRIVIR